MKKISSILFALVLVVSLGLATAAPVLAGTIIHVPGDYPTIQAALNVSEDGDTIMVATGEYDAFLVINQTNISIIGAEGATVTTAIYFAGYGWVMAGVEKSININIEGIDFDGTELSGESVFGILYLDSTGRIADLTVENIIGTELGAGVAIIGDEGTSTVEITGSTISNNEMGIWVLNGSTLEAHFNNIVDNSGGGVVNEGGVTVDATYNWWGDASGPNHESLNPYGSGDVIYDPSDNVDFEPWLEAGVVAAKTETVTGGGTVDAREEADTEVVVDGTATVTVARYDENPGGDAPTDFNALGKYIDVYVPDTEAVTEIEIRLYYTDAEVESADEEYLGLRWWNGTEWEPFSDRGVNTTSTNGYSGYIWAIITDGTTPSLADLHGMPVDGGIESGGDLPPPCGCFIATAAYGTDTAKEIGILREFRDEVLLPNSLGAKLVSFYYETSPPMADFISQHEILRTAVRVGFVDPIVAILTWSHNLWSA